ncbi:flippase [candidate division KSB1 bacterium]|nr:flippase [candidate division KSB1 bacterium]
MTIAQSLLKNTLARTTAEIINRLGSALFWIFVARTLGLTALGVLAFGLSLFSFFHTVSTLGLGAVVIRDVAREHSKAGIYFGQTVRFGCVLAVSATLIMLGFSRLTYTGPEAKMAASILAAALVPASLFYWSKSLLCAGERMPLIAVARLGENIFKVAVGIAVLVWWNGDVTGMATVIFFSKVISALIAYYFASRFAKPVWKMNVTLLKYLRQMTPSFALIAMMNSLFWTAPVIILTHTAGEQQVGLFGAAYKLVDIILSFILAYGQALFPVASRSLGQSTEQFRIIINQSIKYAVRLSLPVAIAVCGLAPHIIHILYGETMLQASPVLRILAGMIVPFSMVPVLAYSLVSQHQQKYDVLANSLAAMAVIALSLVLTPLYGASGAACSVLAATSIFWAIEWVSVRSKIYGVAKWNNKPHAKPGNGHSITIKWFLKIKQAKSA